MSIGFIRSEFEVLIVFDRLGVVWFQGRGTQLKDIPNGMFSFLPQLLHHFHQPVVVDWLVSFWDRVCFLSVLRCVLPLVDLFACIAILDDFD